MNPHYHPYSDLSSPHPPSPDNNNYHPPLGGGHHNGHAQPMSMDPQQGFHQMNNNNGPLKHCGGCGGKIVERYFLHAMDRYWHNSCLKCNYCHAMLAEIGSSCYTKGGMILCKTDYSRIYGSSGACSACGQMIPANELVMRTSSQVNSQPGQQQNQQTNQQIQHHVFHVKCFACSKCGLQLVQGDRYYVVTGSIVCENDWHKLIKTTGANTGSAPLRKGKVGRPRRSRD